MFYNFWSYNSTVEIYSKDIIGEIRYKYLKTYICEDIYAQQIVDAHSMLADKTNDGWWKRENRETETHTYTGF